MFSNRLRSIKILAGLVLLALFSIYSYNKGPKVYPGYGEAIESPQEFAGRKIFFGGKVEQIGSGDFTVRMADLRVQVRGHIEEGRENYGISGTALFVADGSLELLDCHLSNLRKYKVIVSLIPFLVILYLFFRKYTFHFKRMSFEERS